MFSKPLYNDKPEPQKEETVDPILLERQEENEYLATLSNFHWFVYPFFKTAEKLCDKIFGCKRQAEAINEKFRAEREQEQL